jgi:hypothetical protein
LIRSSHQAVVAVLNIKGPHLAHLADLVAVRLPTTQMPRTNQRESPAKDLVVECRAQVVTAVLAVVAAQVVLARMVDPLRRQTINVLDQTLDKTQLVVATAALEFSRQFPVRRSGTAVAVVVALIPMVAMQLVEAKVG